MLRLAGGCLASVLALACGAPPCAAPVPHVERPPAIGDVGMIDFKVTVAPGRLLPATAWYPAERSGPNAPGVPGPKLPILVFSHDLGGRRQDAAFLARRAALSGFLFVAVDHLGDSVALALQRPVDISKLLDMLAVRGGQPLWLTEHADVDHVAVYGHGFGGTTALALAGARVGPNPEWTAYCAAEPAALGCPAPLPGPLPMQSRRDPRVDLAIAAAPAGAFLFGRAGAASVQTPVVLFSGGRDAVITTARDVRPLFQSIRQTRWLVELELANRFAFVDLCARQAWLPPGILAEVAAGCAPDAPLLLSQMHGMIADSIMAVLWYTLRQQNFPNFERFGSTYGVPVRAEVGVGNLRAAELAR